MKWLRGGAALVLLAFPAAVGFAQGGYFAPERLWAAVAAMVVVAIAAVVSPRPLPTSAGGRLAVGGLAGLLAWTVLSRSWAPLAGPAIADAQRLALYLAVLVASAALLRGRRARFAEPTLAAGAVVVLMYGLSERLLPGLIDLTESRSALGRLEQPLTYWNAMGALAAMALVLLARLAGDPTRALRLAAAACAAPVGAALALTYSRGAIVAALVGLAALFALAPARRHLLTVAASAAAAGAVALAVEGAVLLVVLLALGAAGAVAVRRAPEPGGVPPIRLSLVVAGVVVVIGVVAASAALETGTPQTGATATRLASTESNRYAYWRVALGTFAEAPVRGHGAGSFGVLWLRERTVPEVVRDAHSIWFETLAELGVVGVALLLALFAGVALAARGGPPGAVSALVVWAVHSALDWDWELPGGATLTAVVLAGLVIASAEGRARRNGWQVRQAAGRS
jgi:hypothetical protein